MSVSDSLGFRKLNIFSFITEELDAHCGKGRKCVMKKTVVVRNHIIKRQTPLKF